VQSISFLESFLDLVTMTAHLTNEHTQLVLNCQKSSWVKIAVPLKQFQKFLGYVASSAMVTSTQVDV